MRLIDPNELEKVLRPILTDESCPLHIAAEIDMNLDLMPKVDAVSVQRCDGCRYADWHSNGCIAYCIKHGTDGHVADGFCSEGEKDGDHDRD